MSWLQYESCFAENEEGDHVMSMRNVVSWCGQQKETYEKGWDIINILTYTN